MAHYWHANNPFQHLWRNDVNIQTEFFASHKTRMSLFTVKGTTRGLMFVDDLLRIIYHFPFTLPHRAIDRLSHGPNMTDTVATLSYGEDGFLYDHTPYVHFLDNENKFISTDGWFGHIDNVVFYELQNLMSDVDKNAIMDRLFKGDRAPIFANKKAISPKKSTFNSYIRHQQNLDDATEKDRMLQEAAD